MFLESRAMRKVFLLKYKKDLWGKAPPSEAGTITEGAFCDALQKGVGMTREIQSPSPG